MKPRLLVPMTVVTFTLTAGTVTFALTEAKGWGPALLWGLGGGAAAAGAFVVWSLFGPRKPPADD